MFFKNVVIESLAYSLPEEVCTSHAIEKQLSPLYQRLKLPEGRLELMTGIQERRLWPKGTKPSEAATLAAKKALSQSKVKLEDMGFLINASVCRDRLEPATAAYVHAALGLGQRMQVMDLSNACLGFLNAMYMMAGLIDGGAMKAGLIVSGEDARPLLEYTISLLLSKNLDRHTIKPYFANLTIGSGAVAAVLAHSSIAEGIPLCAGTGRAYTEAHHLCEGDHTGGGLLDMQTQSEALMEAGIGLAKASWTDFKEILGWEDASPDRLVCHQVGRQHLKGLYQALGLSLDKDISSYTHLGNMGSASVPITLAMGLEQKRICPESRIALLGIGSGLSSLFLSLGKV
jgi:acyl-CoA:acyl-CoA alkyltransferase